MSPTVCHPYVICVVTAPSRMWHCMSSSIKLGVACEMRKVKEPQPQVPGGGVARPARGSQVQRYRQLGMCLDPDLVQNQPSQVKPQSNF